MKIEAYDHRHMMTFIITRLSIEGYWYSLLTGARLACIHEANTERFVVSRIGSVASLSGMRQSSERGRQRSEVRFVFPSNSA